VTTERNQRGDGAFPAALPGVVSVMPIGPAGLISGVRPVVGPSLSAPAAELVSIGTSGTGNLIGSGTNLAVGYVAGTAALVRAYLPAATAADVRDRLAATTDPVGGATPDPVLGRGVLDPVAAVTTVLPKPSERRDDPPPEKLSVPSAPVVSTRRTDTALRWTMLVLGVGVVTMLVGSAYARGRRRGWTAAADPSETDRDSDAASASPNRA
jgi:hypothetical protein